MRCCKKLFFLSFFFWPLFAQAFIVKAIEYQGFNRISPSAISADEAIKVGQDLTPARSNQTISQLFKTGYFKNVSLLNQNDVLIIQVEEWPTIAKIDFTGNELIKTSDLQTVLNNVGLQVGNMFSQTLVNEIQQSLIQEYNRQGKYAVKVTVDLVPESNNRVNLSIHVSEGLDAIIEHINLIGNTVFSSSTLLKHMNISTPSFTTFFTKSDVYTPQKFSQAIQGLTQFYRDEGFVDFQVTSAVASLDSTHTKAFLTISMTEGQPYQFSGFALKGDLILPEADLAALIQIKPGETYSQALITQSQQAIVTALGDRGYAFANANPVPTLDQTKHQAFITFYVTPGQKVYVNQVRFSGNMMTNDQTLRERTKFVEGASYSKTKLDESTMTLQRLPYMQQGNGVSANLKPVQGSSDKVDVNYDLKEQSATSVNGALGYSVLNGMVINAGFNMNNVFGTGNIFGINASLSRPAQSLNISYTQPFFTQSGIQQTETFYVSRANAAEMGLASFSTNSYGATLGYAIPLSTWNYFNVGVGIDKTDLEQPGNGYQSETVTDFINQYGSRYTTYSVNFGLSRNSTNSAYFPTEGESASAGVNIAVPGSTLTYYQLNTNGTWYHALSQYFTLAITGGVSYGGGYGNMSHLPFFHNYYAGDWGTVRGYAAGSMGPQDTQICTSGTCPSGPSIEGSPLGGNLLVNSSILLRFPVPFMTDSETLRLITFIDSGNVYDTYDSPTVWSGSSNPRSPNFSNLRYSMGFGLEWVSPLGAVGISFARPLNKQAGDSTEVFQFTLGTFF